MVLAIFEIDITAVIQLVRIVVKGQTDNSNKYYTFHVLLPHYQLHLNHKNNNQVHYQNRIINYLLSNTNTKKQEF